MVCMAVRVTTADRLEAQDSNLECQIPGHWQLVQLTKQAVYAQHHEDN